MVYLTLVYHHGGNFVTKDNGSVVYEVDNIDEQDRLDEDTLDVFAVRYHHYDLGYPKILNIRWLEPGRELATGLRTIADDADLLEMCRLARDNNNKVHIYYEHVVSEPQVKEDVPQLIELTPNSVTVEEVPTQTKTTPPKAGQRVNIMMAKTLPKSKSTPKHQSKPSSNPLPKPTPNGPTCSKHKPNPESKAQTCSKTTNMRPKTEAKPKPNPPSKKSTKAAMVSTKIPTRKSPRSACKSVHIAQNLDGSSSDSYDFVKDALYKPRREESSSDDDVECGISQPKRMRTKKKHETNPKLSKMKDKILVEEDSTVTQDSDEEVDWAAVLGHNHGDGASYDAYDPFPNDSDGKDSWESLELKTPPNSEDEHSDGDVDDVFSVFAKGTRFGELTLQVGMKFGAK
ncbi:hypothetical protein PIB30_035802 [Stylosanthes scabra]|uniref:PB1-like domain-containing protein n=1 Tax=Stylosanthes scabra TaxID=79078 RepID=A0ABU6WF86_9FABA|nr:hypothetical protein [Stylosanthes scabra]